MLTKSHVRDFSGTRSDARAHPAWYQNRRTWQTVAEMLYFPIAAIVAYVLVWSLARGEFSVFLQTLGSPS